ncbi:MAG: hypothetical protein AAFR54_13115, partial [Planctomycetota bacterium]
MKFYTPKPYAPTECCAACGSTDLDGFYRLESVPVHSCLMVKSREEALAFPQGTLDLAVCRACG